MPILDKGVQMDVRDVLREISSNLSRFAELLNVSAKAESEAGMPREVFSFSPEEWEGIAIALKHFDMFAIEFRSVLDKDGRLAMLERNRLFLGFIRDLSSMWASRIGEASKA